MSSVRDRSRGESMKIKRIASLAAATMIAVAPAALAQQAAAGQTQANPTPGCTATPAQLEANRRVAMDFFRLQGAAVVALADPTYKQHNPQFVKNGEQQGLSDFQV